jgi:hypothetical protein
MTGDPAFEARLWRAASRFWLGVAVVSFGAAVGILCAAVVDRDTPRKNFSRST